jgi:STE24 endopeptidase
MTAFDLLLKYLNYRNMNAPIPENVKDIYDTETYAKKNAYTREVLGVSLISGMIMTALLLVFLIFNVHSWFFNYIAQYTGSIYLQVMFVPMSDW